MKKKREEEEVDEDSSDEDEEPETKAKGHVAKKRKRIAVSSSDSDSDGDTRSQSKTSATPSNSRSRSARPSKLIDPDAMSDDEGDESYRGSAKRTPSKPKPIVSSSLGLSAGKKISLRDTDLSRALAASRAEATNEQLAHVSSMSTIEESERVKGQSIWDEQPNDPRHLNTIVTGVYLVHPIGSTPNEATLMSHHRSSHTLSTEIERHIRRQVTAAEQGVFKQIHHFITNAFTDPVDSSLENRPNDLTLSTAFTPTPPSSSSHPSGSPFTSHAIPIALVEAGSNIDDHPLLMDGFARFVRSDERRRRDARRADGAEKRKRRKLQPTTATTTTTDARTIEATKSPTKSRSHFYRGLGERKKLGLDDSKSTVERRSDDEEEEEEEDDYDDAESAEFPSLAPFVAILPPTPQTLVGLVKSVYLTLTESYPSPRHLLTHARSVDGALSRKQLDKSGPEGGIEHIIDKLREWSNDWREEREFKYRAWQKRHQSTSDENVAATAAAAAAIVPNRVYPNIVLLLPSLDRFPPVLLSQLIELFLSHPILRHSESLFSLRMVWPIGGTAHELIGSMLKKSILDHLWIRTFTLTPTETIFRQTLHSQFTGWPFVLGSSVLAMLNDHFTTHGSLNGLMKILRFVILDLCDGHDQRGSTLTPTYLIAKSNQLKLVNRSSKAPSDPNGADVDEFVDPVESWVNALTEDDLTALRSLPSVRSHSLTSSSSSSSEFRRRLLHWLDAIEVHRIGFGGGVKILHRLMQKVGFFTHQLDTPTANQAEQQLWTYLQSNELFATNNGNNSSELHDANEASSYAGLAKRFNQYQDDKSLKDTFMVELTHLIQQIESTLARTNLTPVQRRWYQQLQGQYQSHLTNLTNGTIPSTSSSSSSSSNVSSISSNIASVSHRSSSSGAGAMRGKLLFKTANATAQLQKQVLAQVLHHIRAFVEQQLAPITRLPLVELLYYDRGLKLRRLFQPQTESAIYTALTQSRFYLGPNHNLPQSTSSAHTNDDTFTLDLTKPPYIPAARASSSSSSSSSASASSSSLSSSPFDSVSVLSCTDGDEDLVLAFSIFQSMNGVLVNLADWFHAFKAACRPVDWEERYQTVKNPSNPSEKKVKKTRGGGRTRNMPHAHTDTEMETETATAPSTASTSIASPSSSHFSLSDSALQVRFLVCLSTLANLGYLKATNRRVDHVMKLTLHRPY